MRLRVPLGIQVACLSVAVGILYALRRPVLRYVRNYKRTTSRKVQLAENEMIKIVQRQAEKLDKKFLMEVHARGGSSADGLVVSCELMTPKVPEGDELEELSATKSELYQRLDESAWAYVQNNGHVMHYAPGRVIFEKGAQANHFFLLLEGSGSWLYLRR